jgi:uncharacterized protein (DUF1697 family)
MTHYIALLRGVNVGGNRKLPMAELRDKLLALGYAGVRTLLASGNVVLTLAQTDPKALEARLQADLRRACDLDTDVMVRDPAEWDAIIAANPYPDRALSDPSHLLVVALKAPPAPAAVKATLAGHRGPEQVHVGGREAYIYYSQGIGESKLNLKGLGPGTARNWNTVLKLREMLAPSS